MYSIYILYINLNKLYIIICIELTVLNFSPWVQFFNILCDEMGSPVRALGCVTRYLGKHMHSWPTNQSSCFSFKLTRSLFLLERTTDEIQLLNLGYLADIFVKPSQVILLLQRKQMTLFVAKDKIWNLKEKQIFWISFTFYYELDFSKWRLCFFDGTSSELFLNIVYKICQHLEVLYYSVKQYFPKDQWMML